MITEAQKAARLDAVLSGRIERTYAGRHGCTCGCRGSYSTNSRARASFLALLRATLADPQLVAERLDIGENYVAVEGPTTIRIAYVAEGGAR